MAFRLSSHLPHLNPHSHSKSIRSRSHGKPKRAGNENPLFGLFLRCCDSSSMRQRSLASASALPLSWSPEASSAAFDPQIEYGISEARSGFDKTNRIDRLVRSLHEAARSFSVAAESLRLTGSCPELAMAWLGKDIHGWHKRISHMVAVYALLKTAIEVEILLSHERHFNYASPVKETLTPKITLLGEYIESQLNERHSELGEWFRVVEMPRVAAFFVPLLKKWSMEYAGSLNTKEFSGIAGMVVAISCCAAVEKLGQRRITCSSCKFSMKDVMVEFMDQAHSLVTVEKLHQLSNEAGFESDFLTHFGRKIVPSKKSEELEFWIGLAQRELSVAFHKEIINSEGQAFSDKVQANTLATLGLFAYLGKRTRLYLSTMGIKDLDDPVRDFLSYLECGSIFIYPEFCNISSYQSFMEVVTDEIGWLDFYAPFLSSACNQERRRSKQHAVQAEKEIVLSTIFTVCYDAFSGFAHFNRSTQQLLDTDLLDFLLQSQSLLTSCLEDYWAVYGKTSQYLKIVAMSVHDPAHTITAFAAEDSLRNPSEIHQESPHFTMSASGTDKVLTENSNPVHKRLLQKYIVKLMSASTDVWMGSQLLYGDIMMAFELLYKQLRGHEATRRERFKLRRTLDDIGSLIPVTILMLLPVSAVGHAAMLAAIKKYRPSMIPSPYSSARLSVVKQLERTKKMEVTLQSSFEDLSAKIS